MTNAKKGEHHEEYIRWFSELSNNDVAIAGGKGASLGEMYNAGFPVPPGFIVTAQSFDYFLQEGGLKEKIKNIIETIDMENTDELTKKSKEIRALIESQDLPLDLKQEILEAYHILSSEKIDSQGVSTDALNILRNSQEPVFVAVRSSATTEDLAEASFAGQQETFLNVKGDTRLIENVKKCFSSLYTPRAIYYRNKKGFKEGEALLSAVIMKMIDSEKSGVMFSRSPVGDKNTIVVEAVYGLGEGIVSGQINPDNYTVTRELQIKDAKIGDKKIAIVRTGSGQNETVKLTPERSKSQVLSNGQIIEAANYALRLEEHYKKPQDIEFAVEANKIYIVQSRPITTLNKEIRKVGNISGKILLEGQGSSPGVGAGVVKIIKTMADLPKIKKGDVLVTEMTNPDMVVAMEKSVAIVTDEGGMTSHAAIVSREMGIPCVVGTGKATTILKDGMKITVDGTNGKVYEGHVAETHFVEIKPAVKTNWIKIKLLVDLPEGAERASQSGIDAVGLVRLEGIIASSEKHPLQYEKDSDYEDYTELLRKGIDDIAKYFNSLWIRTSDIRSDEYNSLKGAPEKEINPMLGLHGIRFSLKHPKLFEAELLAIKKVAEKHPEKIFGVMFPQVILIEEVKKAREFFDKYKTGNMVFGVMIETPAAVQIIEDICREGINFISFGTNDLTQFTLAVDRGEEDVQFLYNELNPAVFSQLKRVINICRRYKVETSICGQAGSRKEMAEFLFKQGISSISVNADAAYDISKLISELEETKTKEIEERRSLQKNQFQNTQAINRGGFQKPNQQHQHPQHIQQHNQQNKQPYPIFNKNQEKKPYQTSKYHNTEPVPEGILLGDRNPLKIREYNNMAVEKEPERLLNKNRIKIPAEMENDEEIKALDIEDKEIDSEIAQDKFRELKGEEKAGGVFKKKVKDISEGEYTGRGYVNEFQDSGESGGVYEKVGENPMEDNKISKAVFNLFDDEYKWS